MSSDLTSIPLSVVVATRHPWPEIERCVEMLLPQLRACGGELIVGDGDGAGYPDPPDDVRVMVNEGASVFELRRDAIAVATGDIVAATEDHCWVDADWCRRVIDAHRMRPDVVGVAGLVRNGSRGSLAAWASFLVNFAPFTPPYVADPGSRIPPPANVSYKRTAIPADLEVGVLETTFAAAIDGSGRMAVDEDVQMIHAQPYTAGHALRAHFHNGRTTTGLAYAGRSATDKRRHLRLVLVSSIKLAAVTFLHVFKRRSRLPLRALFSLPLVVMLAASFTTGAAVGLLRGPGSSPGHVD